MLEWIQAHYGIILSWTVVITLIGAGFSACIIPLLPGHLIMLSGMILGQIFLPEIHLAWYSWVILSLICVVGSIGDNFLSALGAKSFGSTRAGVWGSIVGLLLGIFLLPGWGIIIGPFLGALVAEIIIERNNIRQSFKSGVGAFLGSISGILLKIFTGIVMLAYFIICSIIN